MAIPSEILARFTGIRESGGQYVARCPAHDDKRHSLAIKQADDRILLHCFAGCPVEGITAAVGLAVTDLFMTDLANAPRQIITSGDGRREVAVYKYRDAGGAVLYENVRFEPKDFRQRRVVDGARVWGLNGVERVPYRLPELMDIQPRLANIVVLTEGEKDADALADLGFTTSNLKQWLRSFNSYLRPDDRIVIIADHDAPGYKLAETTAQVIARDRSNVRVIDLFDGDKGPVPLKHGPDVSDWLAIHVDAPADEQRRRLLDAIRQRVATGQNSPSTAAASVSDPPSPSGRTDDLANSEAFLEFVGDDLLYVVHRKKWLVWTGKYWRIDDRDEVFAKAAEFASQLYERAADDADYKHARRANNRAGFTAMLEFAGRRRSVPITDFNRHPYLLNCANGTLDLRTGTLRPHDAADRLTRLINTDFDSTAVSGHFSRFLDVVQPDRSVQAFLQRSIGYSLLGIVRERSFWILYGTGANGKSIFINLFSNLLGDYAANTNSATIMAANRSGIPNDIARLEGCRYIIIPETEENERIHAALIKQLSAGDQVTARFLFGEFFDFYFTGKLWIATNHKPVVTDASRGFWDRVKLVPFKQTIPPAMQRKSDDLMNDLLSEAPGILAWAVQGCRDYFEVDSLDVPETIQREIDAYRYEQDSIMQFIEECCYTYEQALSDWPDKFVDPINFETDNTSIYKAYRHFCESNGEFPLKHRRLSQKLIERGFKQINRRGRLWQGIRLVDSSLA